MESFLKSRQEICQFLGVSKCQFYHLLEQGLPAKKVFGRWRGSKAKIEQFFSRFLD